MQTATLICALVFTTHVVQFCYFLNPKFTATSHLLSLYISVCKPQCRFSHGATHIIPREIRFQSSERMIRAFCHKNSCLLCLYEIILQIRQHAIKSMPFLRLGSQSENCETERRKHRRLTCSRLPSLH